MVTAKGIIKNGEQDHKEKIQYLKEKDLKRN